MYQFLPQALVVVPVALCAYLLLRLKRQRRNPSTTDEISGTPDAEVEARRYSKVYFG